jgi:hypothetical protein
MSTTCGERQVSSSYNLLLRGLNLVPRQRDSKIIPGQSPITWYDDSSGHGVNSLTTEL